MFRDGMCMLAIVVGTLVIGCSPVKEETIEIKIQVDPLVSAKTMLQQYVDGQPLTSEVTMFPSMVESVRKVHPAKAEILNNGLQAIQAATPEQRPTVAKQVLADLQ